MKSVRLRNKDPMCRIEANAKSSSELGRAGARETGIGTAAT
jgi:hypothetical protein